MQQTFSGDNINKSIERNFEHDTLLMNKRPVTQLKYDRHNLTSQQSSRKRKENSIKFKMDQNQMEEEQKIDQMKEIHAISQINERNKIIFKSR